MRKFQLLALMLFSAQASAGWESVDEGKESTLYADSESVFKQNSYTAIWTLRDYKTEQDADGIKHWSTKNLWLFECKDRTAGLKMSVSYDDEMGLGDIVLNISVEPHQVDFVDVIPDSQLQALFYIACGNK